MKESSIVSFISVTIFQAPASKVGMYLVSFCAMLKMFIFFSSGPDPESSVTSNQKRLDNFRLAFSVLDFFQILSDLPFTICLCQSSLFF